MRTVKLYGHLGKQFGKLHEYDVRTPAEAIRALIANYKGFEQALLDKEYAGFKVIVGNDLRTDKEQLKYPADGDIKIVPIVQGAGGNSTGIIIGAILIVAAIVTFQYEFIPVAAGEAMAGGAVAAEAGTASLAAYSSVAAYAAQAALVVGSSLVLSGIANLLFSPTTPQPRDAEDQITSSYFNGPVNLTTQGNPVPLVYGKLRIGSQVVSAGLLTYKE